MGIHVRLSSTNQGSSCYKDVLNEVFTQIDVSLFYLRGHRINPIIS